MTGKIKVTSKGHDIQRSSTPLPLCPLGNKLLNTLQLQMTLMITKQVLEKMTTRGDEITAHTIIDLIQKKQNKEVLVSMRVVYRLWVDNTAPLYETLTKTLYMRLSF